MSSYPLSISALASEDSIATSIVLLEKMNEFKLALHSTFRNCYRLIERCLVFYPILKQIQTSSRGRRHDQCIYDELRNTFHDVLLYCKQFTHSTMFRSVLHYRIRVYLLEEWAQLIERVCDMESVFQVISSLDHELRRREDIEVSPITC